MEEGTWQGPGQQILAQFSWVRFCHQARATYCRDHHDHGQGGRQLRYSTTACHKSSAQSGVEDPQGPRGQTGPNCTVEQLGRRVEEDICKRKGPLPSSCLQTGAGDGRGCAGARMRQSGSAQGCCKHGGGACRCERGVRCDHAGGLSCGGALRIQRGYFEENVGPEPCEKSGARHRPMGLAGGHHATFEEAACIQLGYEHTVEGATSSAAYRGSAAAHWTNWTYFSFASLHLCRCRSIYGFAFCCQPTLQSRDRWTQEGGYAGWIGQRGCQSCNAACCSAACCSSFTDPGGQAGGEKDGACKSWRGITAARCPWTEPSRRSDRKACSTWCSKRCLGHDFPQQHILYDDEEDRDPSEPSDLELWYNSRFGDLQALE